MSEYLFNKVYYATLLKKKSSTQVFSFEYCKIFKNTYFEEHLRTAASEFRIENPLNFDYLVQIIFFFAHHLMDILYLPQVAVAPPFLILHMVIKVIMVPKYVTVSY